MVNVAPIKNALLDATAKLVGAGSKLKPIQSLGDKMQKNPASTLAGLTVASIVVKDGIGCYKYVTQSLKNDKIPDEKRKFVAALDLTNGVLMIVAQIAMFFAMKKYSGKIFDKIYKSTFGAENVKNFVSEVRMNQAKAGLVPDAKTKILSVISENKDKAQSIFSFVADIAAATIIGKRVIVPLIATPLANKVQKRMDNGVNQNGNNTEENKTEVKQSETGEKTAKPKLDVISSFDGDKDTNLLNRYKKYYGISYKFD